MKQQIIIIRLLIKISDANSHRRGWGAWLVPEGDHVEEREDWKNIGFFFHTSYDRHKVSYSFFINKLGHFKIFCAYFIIQQISSKKKSFVWFFFIGAFLTALYPSCSCFHQRWWSCKESLKRTRRKRRTASAPCRSSCPSSPDLSSGDRTESLRSGAGAPGRKTRSA